MAPDLRDQAPVDRVLQVLAEGRYVLEERLGRGGTAEVWRATDTALDVPRAVKLLLGEGQGREALRRRLRSEARAMARLEHPHILRIYDIGVDLGRDYIVMDLANGGSLSDLLEASGPLPPEVVLDYGLQVLSALSAAHTAGIIHRDVKPQNVLLDRSGKALLADFGIALLAEDAHRKTRTGVAMGSLAYMAPEQRLDARSVGPQADLYAMGTSLFHLLTGENPVDLFAADLDSPRWDPLPEGLRQILFKTTRYEPSQRYAAARDLALALLDLRGSLGTEPLRSPEPTDPSTWSRPSARLALPPADTIAEATGFAITWFGEDFTGEERPVRGAEHEELARRIAALVPEGPAAVGPTIHPDHHPTLVAEEEEPPTRRWLWALPVALLLLLVVAGVTLLPGLLAPQVQPAEVVSSVDVEPEAPPAEAPSPPAPEEEEIVADEAPEEEVEPAVADVALPEPPPEVRPPRPAPPTGPPPLGTWTGSFNGRELHMVLRGSPEAIEGEVVVRFMTTQLTDQVTGHYEDGTLTLHDVGEAEDNGTYTATLDEALGSMQGKHVSNRGSLVSFTARRVQ